jgi:anti-anti-sigma factor
VTQVDFEAVDIPPLRVLTARENGHIALHIDGELDLMTADTFARRIIDLDGAIDQESALVTFDLTGLTFLDAVGYSALVEVSRHLERNGSRMVVSNPTPQVRRFFDLVDECGYDLPFDLDYRPT